MVVGYGCGWLGCDFPRYLAEGADLDMTKPKYAGKHQAMRRAGLQYAYGTACVRCGRVMLPGQPLDLDHRDDGNGWAGFAHASL